MIVVNLLTSVEMTMILALSDVDLGLILCDFSLELYADAQAGHLTADELDAFREQHRTLCTAFSRKLCVRLSDARRTYSLLHNGHRLKQAVSAELEALQRRRGETCENHYHQRVHLEGLQAPEMLHVENDD